MILKSFQNQKAKPYLSDATSCQVMIDQPDYNLTILNYW